MGAKISGCELDQIMIFTRSWNEQETPLLVLGVILGLLGTSQGPAVAEAAGTGSTSVGAVGVRQVGRDDWSRWSDAVAAETRVGPGDAPLDADLDRWKLASGYPAVDLDLRHTEYLGCLVNLKMGWTTSLAREVLEVAAISA
jgi:hypothetical protein